MKKKTVWKWKKSICLKCALKETCKAVILEDESKSMLVCPNFLKFKQKEKKEDK